MSSCPDLATLPPRLVSRGDAAAPRLVFLESNTTGTGRLLAQAARRRGFAPLLLTDAPDRYRFLVDDGVEHAIAPTRDAIATATVIRDMMRTSTPIAGICTSSEYFVALAARLAADLGLRGGDARALEACRSKETQRRVCQAAGVAVPAFACATTPAEAVRAARTIGLPVVVKPVAGSGSVGVRLCRRTRDVADHSAALLAVTVNERGMPRPSHVLVEQFVIGPEFSIETFGTHVVGITRKHVSRLPYFVETGHDFPATLEAAAREALAETTRAALRALGLTWGAAHVEARLTAAGPVIIEINPRLAGGCIPELVRLATGVDLIDATIAVVTGDTPALTPSRSEYASVRFIMAAADGVMTDVAGMNDARRVPGVKDVALYRALGDACTRQHDFRDRIGHAVASSPSPTQAARAATRAARCVQVSFVPPGPPVPVMAT